MPVSFQQKYARYKTTFEFGDEELTYTYDTSKRKTGATVKYDKISRHAVYVDAHLWKMKFFGLFAATLMMLAAVNSIENFGGKTLPAVLVMAAIPLFIAGILAAKLYYNRPTPFTRIKMEPPLYVLEDKQHQAILEEIEKRRRDYIRKKYAVVDFDKTYYDEANKFNWLKREHIISEQEYMQARQKISALRDKNRMTMSGSSTH